MRSSSGPSIRGLLLALTICASGCASVFEVDGALTVIPCRISDTGRIIVTANINGMGPFDFAIDTGASISVILEETAEKAGIRRNTGEYVLIHGMLGTDVYPTAKIDKLTVGSEDWVDSEVVIMPGGTPATAGLDGILGVDFLSRYAVGYSGRNRIIRLYSPSVVAGRSYKGWSSVRLRQLKTSTGDTNLHAIDVTISGHTIPALLDLGAGANLMNDRAMRFIGERLRRRRSDTEVSGAVEAAVVHVELHVSVVETGRIRWRNKKFLVADIHVLDILQLDHRPIAIVGTDFFSDRDFVIDFERNRLLVKAPE